MSQATAYHNGKATAYHNGAPGGAPLEETGSKWVEPLFQQESRSASFGAKVVPSLNGGSGSKFYELSCWILLVKPSGSNILHDIFFRRKTAYLKVENSAQTTNNVRCRFPRKSLITAEQKKCGEFHL